MTASSQAPRQPLPLVAQVVDIAVERTRAQIEPRLGAWARSVPRSMSAHSVAVVLVILAVTAAGGAMVLWVALLWSVATLFADQVPVWATLGGLALVHLAGSGVVAARLEQRTRDEKARALAPTPAPKSLASAPTRSTSPPRVTFPERGAIGRAPWRRSPFRWLLAGFALGLALERAAR